MRVSIQNTGVLDRELTHGKKAFTLLTFIESLHLGIHTSPISPCGCPHCVSIRAVDQLKGGAKPHGCPAISSASSGIGCTVAPAPARRGSDRGGGDPLNGPADAAP